MASYYPGDEIKISMVFADASSTDTDPDDATLSYGPVGTASPTTTALAAMTRDSAGNYHVVVDTTSFDAGEWEVQVVATGAVAAVDVAHFVIKPLPL